MIPSSFVPKPQVVPAGRAISSGSNIFLLIAIFIFGVSIIAAIGVFLDARYLASVETAKSTELTNAESQVSQSTVKDFLRLRNRLAAAETLISNHVELSQFFALLESITIQDVNFDSLNVTVAQDGSAQIQMTGNAKTFNALALESTAFAAQKDIKSAIFSGITLNKDGTVGFSLMATLDHALVVEGKTPGAAAIIPAAPSASTSTAQATPAVAKPAIAATTTSASTTKP
jgi:hypothetical protein